MKLTADALSEGHRSGEKRTKPIRRLPNFILQSQFGPIAIDSADLQSSSNQMVPHDFDCVVWGPDSSQSEAIVTRTVQEHFECVENQSWKVAWCLVWALGKRHGPGLATSSISSVWFFVKLKKSLICLEGEIIIMILIGHPGKCFFSVPLV